MYQWCSGWKKALNDFPLVLAAMKSEYGTLEYVHLLRFVHSSPAYLITEQTNSNSSVSYTHIDFYTH